jgi:hypothetical protein
VNWKTACLPKHHGGQGGLGMLDLEIMNIALFIEMDLETIQWIWGLAGLPLKQIPQKFDPGTMLV